MRACGVRGHCKDKTCLADDERPHALGRVWRHIYGVDLKLKRRERSSGEEEGMRRALTKTSLGCMEFSKEAGEPLRMLCITCWYLEGAQG